MITTYESRITIKRETDPHKGQTLQNAVINVAANTLRRFE